MDFRFDLNKFINGEIVKVNNDLVPDGFRGDRQAVNECKRYMESVLDEMGEASAKAQGLKKSITNATKLKNSDHILYLFIDQAANDGNGSVVGLLKLGNKHLFVFDATGAAREVNALCVLDFYIHESRQRVGCGKHLYEHMLRVENVKPAKLAIDKPSEKFLGFMHKHYGLNKIIPQSNNYILYEEFFDDMAPASDDGRRGSVSRSRGGSPVSRNKNIMTLQENGPQNFQSYGRHAAHKHPDTMGKLLGQVNNDSRAISMGGAITPKSSTMSTPRTTSPAESMDSLHTAEADSPQQMPDEPSPLLPEKAVAVQNSVHLESIPPPKTPPATPSPSASCQQDHVAASGDGEHRDLKFYHSPLW